MPVISQPVHALSTNRKQLSKINPILGEPNKWFSHRMLNSFSLNGISFDFFINWTNNTCQNEVWIKRISSLPIDELEKLSNEELTQLLNDAEDHPQEMCRFTQHYSLALYYMIFRDVVDWLEPHEKILRAEACPEGISRTYSANIRQLQKKIQDLSGGPIKIGSKGLTYSTSGLEGFLSHTDAAWPGDVDTILYDDKSVDILAILEFKKHNLKEPIQEQGLSKYYPRPDGRKYDRLALLKEHLGNNFPLIVIYYPTNPNETTIKLEWVEGRLSRLTFGRCTYINYAGKTSEQVGAEIIQTIISSVSK